MSVIGPVNSLSRFLRSDQPQCLSDGPGTYSMRPLCGLRSFLARKTVRSKKVYGWHPKLRKPCRSSSKTGSFTTVPDGIRRGSIPTCAVPRVLLAVAVDPLRGDLVVVAEVVEGVAGHLVVARRQPVGLHEQPERLLLVAGG